MASTFPSQALGETNLETLLSTLEVVLSPETFVFLTLPASGLFPESLYIHMLFREAEGTTIITTQDEATSHGLEFTFPSKMITLNIHSSLEAVGFMAVISAKLAEHGISCNPVSGYFHDHCFVPFERALEAANLLQELADLAKSQQATRSTGV
jgi:hypothetical protein